MKSIFKTNLLKFVVMAIVLIALIVSSAIIVSANNTPMYHVGVGGLSAPVAGRLPDCDVTPNGQYTASVQWFHKEGNDFIHHTESEPLKAGEIYQAAVHLEAKSGYYFDTASQHFGCTINGIANTTFKVVDETHVIMYHSYPALAVAPVETSDISIDLPRAGSFPSFDSSAIGNCIVDDYSIGGYINGILWIDTITGKTLNEDDVFVAGRTYRVQVVIKSDDDHTFDNASANSVRINNKTATLTKGDPTPTSEHRIASATFTTPETITEINVKDFVAPVVGNTPDFRVSVDVEGVEVGAVSWGMLKNVDGVEKVVDVDENHVFEDGATYMLCINLENKSNKTFAVKDGVAGFALTANVGDKKATNAPWREYDEHNVLQTLDFYNYIELQVWYTLKQDVIHDIDILQLPTPVADEAPSAGMVWVAQDDIVIESITWGYVVNENGYERVVELKDGETFRKGVSYSVNIRLRNTGNAVFNYDPDRESHMMSATINWKSASVSTIFEHTGYDYVAVDPYNYVEVYAWFYCNGEVVDKIDIGGITAPVAGETPSFDKEFLNTGYLTYGNWQEYDFAEKKDVYTKKDGVSWYDVTYDSFGDVLRENDKFIGGHTYQVRFYIQAATNCRFDCDTTDTTNVIATVNGVEAKVDASGLSSTEYYLVVSYTFECPTITVDKIEIELPDPVVGESPCYDKISTDEYYSDMPEAWKSQVSIHNGIIWFDNLSQTAPDPSKGDVFAENTDYSVGIYLVLNDGYVLGDEVEVFINGYKVYTVYAINGVVLIQNDYPITECIHNIVSVDATAPTCTENGFIAHYECDKCHQMFIDANGENLLDDGEDWTIIPATGHSFTEYICEDGMYGNHKAVCSCGGYEIIECDYDVKIIAAPNEYAERAVMLYTCKYCDHSYFSPFESMTEEKESFEDNSTGVKVSFGGESTSVPSDVTLEVENVYEERIPDDKKESINEIAGGNADIVVGYNIAFEYGSIQYVPTQTVVVTIPLGDSYNSDDVYKVIYTDYTYYALEVYDCEKNDEDGSVSFETDHFSIYFVVRVEESNSGNDPENPGGETPENPGDETPENTDNSEKDHSKCLEEASGWKRFWNAIGNFFRRIFSKYVKCVCGDKLLEEDYTEFKNIFKGKK